MLCFQLTKLNDALDYEFERRVDTSVLMNLVGRYDGSISNISCTHIQRTNRIMGQDKCITSKA